MNLTEAKRKAKLLSIQFSCRVYVNKDGNGFVASTHYDKELTLITYQNGKEL